MKHNGRIRSYLWRGAMLLPVAGMLLAASGASAAPVDSYKVVNRYPHSKESYTEGFFYRDGMFYEGTGMKGHSGILVTVPETGKVLQSVRLPEEYFGEGIVDWGANILEWTWKAELGFVYDRFSLRAVKQFHYKGEGWGMTRTAKEIITSDGSATLRFRNPETFAETHHLAVTDEGRPVEQLNELEYVKGEIYANVWHEDRVARISPRDGHVIRWIDLTGLIAESDRVNDDSVLNGIAYDAEHDRLFVTGKQWPWVFEIREVRRGSGSGGGVTRSRTGMIRDHE